jgi:HTH-like domain
MRYAFIKGHHQQFNVRRMCNMLTVHPSGFYAWLKRPFSKRTLEDERQTQLLKEAWEGSGKVYGYRKLHDDLQDQGETCCPNGVARLAKMAGIKAQIGYKRRVGIYGGKPSLAVDNTLDRQFDTAAPDTAWSRTSPTSKLTRALPIWLSSLTCIPAGCRLVHPELSNNGPRSASPARGGVSQKAEDQSADPFSPRLTVQQHRLGSIPETAQSRTQHEPPGELSRQRSCRKLLQPPEE